MDRSSESLRWWEIRRFENRQEAGILVNFCVGDKMAGARRSEANASFGEKFYLFVVLFCPSCLSQYLFSSLFWKHV